MPVTKLVIPNLESRTISEVEPFVDSAKLIRVHQLVMPFIVEFEVSVVYLRLIWSELSGREHLILLWPYPFASVLAVRF